MSEPPPLNNIRLTSLNAQNAVVEIAGYFHREDLARFREVIEEVQVLKPSVIHFHCSHLLHIDSAMLGCIVDLHHRCEEEGRKVILHWVPDLVLRIFDLTNLDLLLHIEKDRRGHKQVPLPLPVERSTPGELKRCWELYGCEEPSCTHYKEPSFVCWMTPNVPCKSIISQDLNRELTGCVRCEVFQNNINQYGLIQQDYRDYIHNAESTYLRLVDERIQNRQRAGSNQEWVERLFRQVTDAVVLFDGDSGDIRMANPQAVKIIGVLRAEAGPQNMYEVCPENRDIDPPWKNKLFPEDSALRRWHQRWSDGQGNEIEVEVTYSGVPFPSDGTIMAIARPV